MNGLEAIKNRIAGRVAESEKQREECMISAQEAKEREAEAAKAAEQAYQKGDVKAYHKAQDEIRLNMDAAAMYKEKAKKIEATPIIDKAEFDQICKDTFAYMNGIVAKDRAAIKDLAKELDKILKAEEKEMKEVNAFLENVQRNVYKEKIGYEAKVGWVDEPWKVKKYKDWRVLECLRFILSHPLIDQMMKEG